jgi:hypothetical protein
VRVATVDFAAPATQSLPHGRIGERRGVAQCKKNLTLECEKTTIDVNRNLSRNVNPASRSNARWPDLQQLLNCLTIGALAGALEERPLGHGLRRFAVRETTVFFPIKVVSKLPLCCWDAPKFGA